MARRQSGTYRIRKSQQIPVVETDRPRSWYRPAAGAVQRDVDPREIERLLADPGGFLWVDVDTASPAQVALLEKAFHLHPLVVEDTLSPNGRVKVEEYHGYLFVVVRAVRFVSETEDPHDIETYNLCCVLGSNYLLTIHGSHSPGLDEVWSRVQRSPDLLDRGAARMMHAVLDATVDAYFPIVDQLDEFIDSVEERVFAKFDQAAMHDIFGVKRLVLQLRRHLAPQREVFSFLTNRPNALVPPEVQVYFRDIYDHVIRLNESIDTYRDLVSSVMESYLTQVSNRLNIATKSLTVVATLSVPFVVVSGMWGMNFAEIPLSHWPHGFWVMFLGQLVLGVLLILALKRRGVL
ncbi:MAG: magnesium/cobalt transporter CorA [Gemmatimonadaceae bacterium]